MNNTSHSLIWDMAGKKLYKAGRVLWHLEY